MRQINKPTVLLVTAVLAAVSFTTAEPPTVAVGGREVPPADEAVRAAWGTKWEANLNENADAWDAWRRELNLATESDEAYVAAVRALRAVEFDPGFFDSPEVAALVATRDKEYRRIALRTYEQKFGPWQGEAAEFDVLIELVAGNNVENIKACAESAIYACGKGNVCSVDVSAEGACSVVCKADAQ